MDEDQLVTVLAESPGASALLVDFDGTLAEIVADPDKARAPAAVVEDLHTIARHLRTVAVVSGRPAGWLASRLELASHASPLRAVGLHGLEEVEGSGQVRLRHGADDYREGLERAMSELSATLPPGTRIEDKGRGVTVHWRALDWSAGGSAVEEGIARRAEEVVREVGSRLGFVLRPGKASIEIVVPLGVDKGTVTRELASGHEEVAFIGDDASDLPAFIALDELSERAGARATKVAVSGPGEEEAPPLLEAGADLVLDGPEAVARLLARLSARLRHDSGAAGVSTA